MASGTPTERPSPAPQPNPPSSEKSDGDLRVLIVDDNVPTARALAALLATAHYKSAVFHRGTDALNYARQQRCLAAVVDIGLPDVSGIDVAEQLRVLLGDAVPIVVVSGDTSLSTLGALSKVRATHFFSKPVNATQLLERLCQWIAEAHEGG